MEAIRGVLCDPKESDTMCWGVKKAKSPLELMNFKLPKLEDSEVRINITYAGLCHSDCFKVDDEWGGNAAWPLIPGHEIVGEIQKVGKDVKTFKVGDSVCVGVFRDCCGSCVQCKAGLDNLCIGCPYKFTYDPHLGGYSTVMQIKAGFVFPLNKGLDPARAAPLLCAGVTTFAPLKRFARPGAKCAVIGIGGLGHLGIQYANKMGMKVTAISTSPEKEKEAKSFGAHEFICSKDKAQMANWMKDPSHIILNTAYIADLTSYMLCLAPGGKFVNVGLPEVSKPILFNHLEFVCSQKELIGSVVGCRSEVVETLDFSELHNILPTVETYSWKDMPQAYERLHSGKAHYRCVVKVK
jgi:uncharacterized zinc-type alcohol dehydrogenase-like protein